MARSIAVIKAAIMTAKNADPNLNGTNFPKLKFFEEGGSMSSMANGIAYLMAWAQNLQEQLWDLFSISLQAIADSAISGNGLWIQNEILKFQYDANTPQVVQVFPDFTVGYAPVAPGTNGGGGTPDSTKQIITACAVVDSGNRIIQIKVAKTISTGPTVLGKLSSAEQTAINAYASAIRFAGTKVLVTSNDPDKIYIQASITYDKTRDAGITKTNIIAAITSYLQQYSLTQFNGLVYPSKISDAIQSVDGVINVYFQSLSGRDSTTSVKSDGVDFTSTRYGTAAGYAVPEDQTGYTLNDSLTLI